MESLCGHILCIESWGGAWRSEAMGMTSFLSTKVIGEAGHNGR